MSVVTETKFSGQEAGKFPPGPQLRDAMRRLTGGVSVITAGQGEHKTGLTVTTAHSLSADPPLMIISVNRNSSSYPVIRENGHFCVNILSASQQRVAERFSGFGGIKGAARYDGEDWVPLASGALALEGALANIDCEVEELIERHSHGLFLGRVVKVRVSAGTDPQLIYQHGAYGAYRPGRHSS
jgi:flavin reductase (DIM6/NTAB) family NADH-FMN oxidoreductase RutF